MNSRVLAIKFIRSRLFKAVFSVGCLVASILLSISLVDLTSKKGIIVEREAILVHETAQNNELKEKLTVAKTPEFVEQVARGKLGLVKPGETVVIMNTTNITNSTNTPNENQENLPNWKKWWKLFF